MHNLSEALESFSTDPAGSTETCMIPSPAKQRGAGWNLSSPWLYVNNILLRPLAKQALPNSQKPCTGGTSPTDREGKEASRRSKGGPMSQSQEFNLCLLQAVAVVGHNGGLRFSSTIFPIFQPSGLSLIPCTHIQSLLALTSGNSQGSF